MRHLSICLWLFAATGAYAHGGGLDSNGCHHDRKNGGYHCHRAVVAPTPSAALGARPSRQYALASVRTTPAPVLLSPTCHVGPRGGTYTITASGRKNYSGC
ncbi:YHYH domain-containing protein [Piscinibacter koreensis]|uniref:YHYH domain-containing protein n=1 Tax=Piscinibacter koreensis TaxID=2742824 RepID=A0A7Y6NP10_9BURK|nr:YHYH domain-containing protein [Schlegelella koreensis]NUZ06733.1 YHYH domain-containing protein [Schlegelella koreensis]